MDRPILNDDWLINEDRHLVEKLGELQTTISMWTKQMSSANPSTAAPVINATTSALTQVVNRGVELAPAWPISMTKTQLARGADVLSNLVMLVMLSHTFWSVYRRKRGQLSRAPVQRLLKFWVCYTVVESFTLLLRVFATLLHMHWSILYQSFVVPRFDKYQRRVDTTLTNLQHQAEEVRKDFFIRADEHIHQYKQAGIAALSSAIQDQYAKTRALEQLLHILTHPEQLDEQTLKVEVPQILNQLQLRNYQTQALELPRKLAQFQLLSESKRHPFTAKNLKNSAFNSYIDMRHHNVPDPQPVFSGSRQLRESFRKRAQGARNRSTT